MGIRVLSRTGREISSQLLAVVIPVVVFLISNVPVIVH